MITVSLPVLNVCVCVFSHCRVWFFCDPMYSSLPGFSVHGINQARILEWDFLLQGIFSTQGLNLCLLHLLHWQADSLPLHHLGSLPMLSTCVLCRGLLVMNWAEKYVTKWCSFILIVSAVHTCFCTPLYPFAPNIPTNRTAIGLVAAGFVFWNLYCHVF